MFELISTRNNPMIDPGLHVWGFEIPLYLFLGGFVAGLMVLSGLAFIRGGHERRSSVYTGLPLIGLVLLSLGMLALFALYRMTRRAAPEERAPVITVPAN